MLNCVLCNTKKPQISVLDWNIEKLLWISHLKENTNNNKNKNENENNICYLTKLPKDLILHILLFLNGLSRLHKNQPYFVSYCQFIDDRLNDPILDIKENSNKKTKYIVPINWSSNDILLKYFENKKDNCKNDKNKNKNKCQSKNSKLFKNEEIVTIMMTMMMMIMKILLNIMTMTVMETFQTVHGLVIMVDYHGQDVSPNLKQ